MIELSAGAWSLLSTGLSSQPPPTQIELSPKHLPPPLLALPTPCFHFDGKSEKPNGNWFSTPEWFAWGEDLLCRDPASGWGAGA